MSTQAAPVKSKSLKEVGKSPTGSSIPKPNLFKWNIPITTVTCFILFGLVHDLLIFGDFSRMASEGNYAFRESIRETRRVKTAATYARKRGPLIVSSLKDYPPLASRGVTHLEDSFGGLISGPPKLWRHGEILVSSWPKGIKREMELFNFKDVSSVYWNNGDKDPCNDRTIYVGGERLAIAEGMEEIQVVIGTLVFKCGETVQRGYVSMLWAAHHGGPLVGRIYRVHGSIGLDEIPINSTSWDGKMKLEMEEVGSFIEARGYGRSTLLFVSLLLVVLPGFAWLVFLSRVANCKVIVQISVSNETIAAMDERRRSSSRAIAPEEKPKAKKKEKKNTEESAEIQDEFRLEGYLSHNVIATYKYPIIYGLMIIVLPIIQSLQDESGTKIIREIVPNFKKYGISVRGAFLWILSQELAAWLLLIISSLPHSDFNLKLNKGIVYAYQRCPKLTRTIGALNYVGVTVSVIDFFQFLESIELAYFILSLSISLMHILIVAQAFQVDKYDIGQVCTLAGARRDLSLSTRALSMLLAGQVNSASSKRICSDERMGLAFRGTIMEAAFLANTSLFMEAFFHSNIVQLKCKEYSTDKIGICSRLRIRGEHDFKLIRHWKDCGKTSVVIA